MSLCVKKRGKKEELRNKNFLQSWRVFTQRVKVHFLIYNELLKEAKHFMKSFK